MLKKSARRVFNKIRSVGKSTVSNTKFWTDHNVTYHTQFKTIEESINYFQWRTGQYYKYIDFMPVEGFDDKVVLDFGCGPGHDLVGFGVYSKPEKLIGVDISSSSLAQAASRLKLHHIDAEFTQITEDTVRLPFEDNSIDHIHSSGVLHHTNNPEALLRDFKRILKPSGECRIMIYNYESIWLHLYVAYYQQITQGKYQGVDVRTAFSKCTDGENCPLSRVYKAEEFVDLCDAADFNSVYLGAALSTTEMDYLPYRYKAIQEITLDKEHRDFLMALTLDEHGFAMYKGYYAGVDGCYSLKKE